MDELEQFVKQAYRDGYITRAQLESLDAADWAQLDALWEKGDQPGVLVYVQNKGKVHFTMPPDQKGQEYKVGRYYQQPEYGTDGKPTGRLFTARYEGQTPIEGYDTYGAKVITGYQDKWAASSLVKPEVPEDVFVDVESIGGYDFPVFERSDGTTYVGKTKLGQTIVESTGLTPSEQLSRDRFDWEKQRDIAAREAATVKSTWDIQKELYDREAAQRAETLARQTTATNQWLAAQKGNAEAVRQAGYAAQEERYQQLMPNRTAENWINTWRYQNTPNLRPKPPSGIGSWTQSGQIGFAPNQTAAERKGLTGWVAPGQVGPDKGAMWTNQGRQTIMSDPNYPGGRPETDAEFNYRTKTLLLRAAEEGGWINKGGSSDPYVASALAEWHKYNPEPGGKREVAAFRDWELGIGKRPPTFFRPEWESQRGGFLESQYEIMNRMKGPPGPQLPTWGYGLGAPTQAWRGKQYLDVAALQRSKGVGLSPLSAQRAQSMAPSELAGYRGLVQAGKRDWGDFEDNMLKMWRASRPGQQAQRRPRSY